MKITLDAAGIARVAELAFAEVLATEPRTAERRAAVCLYYAVTVPPAKSVRAIRKEIGSYAETTQAAALDLLGRLAVAAAGTQCRIHPEPTGDRKIMSGAFLGGDGPDAAALARAAGLLKALDDGDAEHWARVLEADYADNASGPYITFVAMTAFAYALTTAVADLSGDTRDTVMANVTAALVNLTTDTDSEGEER